MEDMEMAQCTLLIMAVEDNRKYQGPAVFTPGNSISSFQQAFACVRAILCMKIKKVTTIIPSGASPLTTQACS
jgi:hypothetical protein